MQVRDRLNEVYEPLCRKMKEILSKLNEFECTYGFYNNHSHRNDAGEYVADIYPIPVISVKNVCDIEIDFCGIGVTAKLSKENSLYFDYSQICGYEYEIYGVEEYLTDYYSDGESIDTALNKMSISKETEFFYTFCFTNDASSDEIIRSIKNLANIGFYY